MTLIIMVFAQWGLIEVTFWTRFQAFASKPNPCDKSMKRPIKAFCPSPLRCTSALCGYVFELETRIGEPEVESHKADSLDKTDLVFAVRGSADHAQPRKLTSQTGRNTYNKQIAGT